MYRIRYRPRKKAAMVHRERLLLTHPVRSKDLCIIYLRYLIWTPHDHIGIDGLYVVPSEKKS